MNDKIKLLAGCIEPCSTPWEVFDERVIGFLDEVSCHIRKQLSREDDSAAALGFWLRRSHVTAMKKQHPEASCYVRTGRGLIMHITPSNVPLMFAYSLAIGLLSGNTNIVRLSVRRYAIEEKLCRLIDSVLSDHRFESLKNRISIISYDRDDAITEDIFKKCDARIIWGGDATIASMRRIPMPPHAVELCFPDRWSAAVISLRSLMETADNDRANDIRPVNEVKEEKTYERRKSASTNVNSDEIEIIARRFYNDTYSMDQNACSSPQMVIWLDDINSSIDHLYNTGSRSGADDTVGKKEQDNTGSRSGMDDTDSRIETDNNGFRNGSGKIAAVSEKRKSAINQEKEAVKAAFWSALARIAEKEYELSPYQSVRKFVKAAEITMTDQNAAGIRNYEGNYTCVIRLDSLPPDLSQYKGGDGLFYEVTINHLYEIAQSISLKVQTLTTCGIDNKAFAELLKDMHARGADRIVPVGQALEMNTIWDGKDMIAELSRMIAR